MSNGKIVSGIDSYVEVAKQNSQLVDEVSKLYNEIDWYRKGLTLISKMSNESSPIALKVLAHQPFP